MAFFKIWRRTILCCRLSKAFRNGKHWRAGRPGPLGSGLLGKWDVSFARGFSPSLALEALNNCLQDQLLSCCLYGIGENCSFGISEKKRISGRSPTFERFLLFVSHECDVAGSSNLRENLTGTNLEWHRKFG